MGAEAENTRVQKERA